MINKNEDNDDDFQLKKKASTFVLRRSKFELEYSRNF